jgi:glycosyltransferase involved in cell wall biosynthesis
MNQLVTKKISIISHVATTGPAQELLQYLNEQKTQRICFIGHPLTFNKKYGSFIEIYSKGKFLSTTKASNTHFPEPFLYIKDVFLNIWWGIKHLKGFDLVVACDNLNAICAIFLKKIKIVNRVVYYVIDYAPKRFSSNILNYIYHKIDEYCVQNADETWNVSPRMEEVRKMIYGPLKGKQIVVPIGTWLKDISKIKRKKYTKRTLVYFGGVSVKQGLVNVIRAIPSIIKKIPNFQFIIVGGGNYSNILIKEAASLNVSKYIIFTGYIDDIDDALKIIKKCNVAIAPYEKFGNQGEKSFTYYSDPMKLKQYLACGLPVILTDVPYNAKLIDGFCGSIIKPNPSDISKKVISLMNNSKKLNLYSKNAIEMALNFDWDKIFSKNINRVLSINK